MREVLVYYGIQLVHQTPGSILYLVPYVQSFRWSIAEPGVVSALFRDVQARQPTAQGVVLLPHSATRWGQDPPPAHENSRGRRDQMDYHGQGAGWPRVLQLLSSIIIRLGLGPSPARW